MAETDDLTKYIMSYYKQRLEHDSEEIRTQIARLGRKVEAALRASLTSLMTRDDEQAYTTIISDHPINRAVESIDRECHFFIARHLPSAGYLRFVSSAIKMNLLLERMGDYAATIARESVQMTAPLTGTFRSNVEAMAADALDMFDKALTAFLEKDEALARETIRYARQVDRDFMIAFDYLKTIDPSILDTEDLFARLSVISRLERVSDQAKNLCEETLFSLTGETKKRRPMRILFLEEGDDCYAPLAVAIGRRFFPDRGTFTSAGSNPGSSIREDVAAFLEEYGLVDYEPGPSPIDWADDGWSSYDVIISINGSYSDYVNKVPFLTVAFDWWLPESENDDNPLSQAHQFLHANIEDLIVTLRGESKKET